MCFGHLQLSLLVVLGLTMLECRGLVRKGPKYVYGRNVGFYTRKEYYDLGKYSP